MKNFFKAVTPEDLATITNPNKTDLLMLTIEEINPMLINNREKLVNGSVVMNLYNMKQGITVETIQEAYGTHWTVSEASMSNYPVVIFTKKTAA